jgi:cytochrome c6
MNRVPWRTFAGLTLFVVTVVIAGCTASSDGDEHRPRAATRIVILTPVPTIPSVPAVVAGATVAPQPAPGPSAHAPTPPSAEGVATAEVEIGEITRVPILENTPAFVEVGTVTLPQSDERNEVAPGAPEAGTPGEDASAQQDAMRTPGADPASEGDVTGTPEANAQGEGDLERSRAERGQQVFDSSCASCHGVGGQGVGDFPPLDGSEVVRGDPQPVIQTVLNGRGLMPAWRDQLSDEQIAGVVTYIRSAWSNDAPGVTAQTVADQRDQLP